MQRREAWGFDPPRSNWRCVVVMRHGTRPIHGNLVQSGVENLPGISFVVRKNALKEQVAQYITLRTAWVWMRRHQPMDSKLTDKFMKFHNKSLELTRFCVYFRASVFYRCKACAGPHPCCTECILTVEVLDARADSGRSCGTLIQ